MNGRLKFVLRLLTMWAITTTGVVVFFMAAISFGLWWGTGQWLIEWEFCWVVVFISGVCSVEFALQYAEEKAANDRNSPCRHMTPAEKTAYRVVRRFKRY